MVPIIRGNRRRFNGNRHQVFGDNQQARQHCPQGLGTALSTNSLDRSGVSVFETRLGTIRQIAQSMVRLDLPQTKESHMANNGISKAETSAWFIGQYKLAETLIENLEQGHDMADTLDIAIKSIMEPVRNNDQIHLMFELMNLRARLRDITKQDA